MEVALFMQARNMESHLNKRWLCIISAICLWWLFLANLYKLNLSFKIPAALLPKYLPMSPIISHIFSRSLLKKWSLILNKNAHYTWIMTARALRLVSMILPSLSPLPQCWLNLVKTTYNFLVRIVPAAVCCGQCWGTLLCIPRRMALLWSTADGDCVDAVCVTITVTIISLAATVPWGPDKKGTFPFSSLKEMKEKRWLLWVKICALSPRCNFHAHFVSKPKHENQRKDAPLFCWNKNAVNMLFWQIHIFNWFKGKQ